MEYLKHFSIPREYDLTNPYTIKSISSVVADMTDNAVYNAIIRSAQESGVTDLYLMDKKFVADALREKLERENQKPLTIQELIQMQDQPVWVKYLNAPELDRWGIVESASEIDGEKYLFLRGEYGYVEYGKGVVTYRYKPKEDPHGK